MAWGWGRAAGFVVAEAVRPSAGAESGALPGGAAGVEAENSRRLPGSHLGA